jgi:hypothetical protein
MKAERGRAGEVLEVWRFFVLDAALKPCLLTLRPATSLKSKGRIDLLLPTVVTLVK